MKKALSVILSLLCLLLLCSCSSYSGAVSDSRQPAETKNPSETIADSTRKVIQNAELSCLADDYDAFYALLTAKVAELGGYIESSNSYGTEGDKSGRFTIRVPAEKLESFIGFASDNSKIESDSRSTDDVTASYFDAEGRLAALRAEQTGLLALLEEAQSMQDIITIRERLTQLGYEIESYEKLIRGYDNKVQYSTVMLYVYEDKMPSLDSGNVWGRIGSGISESFAYIGLMLTELFIALAVALPYLLCIGVIVAIVIVCVRLRRRSAKRKAQDVKESKGE